ncbi:unnamed protein product [Choristocarpus tenellus]
MVTLRKHSRVDVKLAAKTPGKVSDTKVHDTKVPNSKFTFSRKGDWSAMTAARWHDSLYYEGSYFWRLFKDTQIYTKRATAIYCGAPSRCTHVEVGCGTGDVILSMARDFDQSIGVDINEEFLEYAKFQLPKNLENRVTFCAGSATDLVDLVNLHVPSASQGNVVVTCVNNTLGVFPEDIKPKTYQQMKDLAGERGIIVVGFWNGDKFGDALQHFYSVQSALCGSLKGAEIDFKNRKLCTVDGYLTKWTNAKEARVTLEKYGFNVLDITEVGVGVLCTCSGGKKSSHKASTLYQNILPSTVNGSRTPPAAPASPCLTSKVEDVESPILNHYSDSFSQYFYNKVWGGRHQHIGIYNGEMKPEMPSVEHACEDSTALLFSKACPCAYSRAVEFGSGFGSGARYAAGNFGATVTCVDLSQEANECNRRLTAEAGLSDLVHICKEMSFFATELPSASFDLCFSQARMGDALCHAGNTVHLALAEAARLLVPRGTLAITNILCGPKVTQSELDPILPRLQLSVMQTTESFIAMAVGAGFEIVECIDKTASMAVHFETILEAMKEHKNDMLEHTSPEYIEELTMDLHHWADASTNGVLSWCFFIFRKCCD